MGSLTKESKTLYAHVKDFDVVQQTLDKLIEKYVYEEDGTAYDKIGQTSITTGTCFMRRLNTFLVAYLASVQEKELWGQGVEIVFSGASVEGEGEHKIISDIKKSKFVAPSEYAYERGE